MPPRKSNISQATATDNDGGTPVKERDGTNIEEACFRCPDFWIPRTVRELRSKNLLTFHPCNKYEVQATDLMNRQSLLSEAALSARLVMLY
ncbi:hypothetical protein P7C71_g623, partial [Lecanoromycetidae sp. Uapishka_2]